MIRVLVTGTLYGQPTQRTGRDSGKDFITAKLRVDTGEELQVWASLIAFGEKAERLTGLKDGDAVSVAGRATLQAYTNRGGEPGASLSVVVDDVASIRRKPKPKRQAERHGAGFADDDLDF